MRPKQKRIKLFENPTNKMELEDDFQMFLISPPELPKTLNREETKEFFEDLCFFEEHERKKTKVLNICQVFRKINSAIDFLNNLKTEYYSVNLLNKEEKMRVIGFQFCPNSIDVYRKMFNNHEKITFNNSEIYPTFCFFVCNYQKFWSLYCEMGKKGKHFYEIIREDEPVFLYFDIEGPFLNQKDELYLLKLLKNEIIIEFRNVLNINLTHDDIIDLRSDTNKKFSHHFIIKPKIGENPKKYVVFKNVNQCKFFVHSFIYRLQNEKESKYKNFFYTIDNQTKCYIDKCVYTKNRLFRILGSRKLNKEGTLKLVSKNKILENLDEGEVFFQTLATNVDMDCIHYVNSFFEPSNNLSSTNTKVTKTKRKKKQKKQIDDDDFSPLKDFIIEQVIKRGNKDAIINKYKYFPENNCAYFSIGGNRFCENINREHKSNHVYYVVYFSQMVYFQKCSDPCCKGFCSQKRELPYEVIPEIVKEKFKM